jgi:putative ABC transport system permease protein
VWRLTLRSARAHWRRFVLTALAVVVGVSFVVGSFVLTDSLAGSIRSLLKDSAGRSDFVVRRADGNNGGPGGLFGGSRAGVTMDVATRLADVPGVAAADGVVSGAAQLLDKAGDSGAFDFTLLSNWPSDPAQFGVTLQSGRAPTGSDDVVLDTVTAADRGISVGDRIRIATRRGVVSARVSGLADQRASGLVAAAPVLAFSRARAQDLVGVPGWFGVVNVRVVPGADKDAVQARLQAVGGPAVTVLSSDVLLARAQADIEEQLSTFVGLLLGFAAVTLFVSAFLIWNTFTIVVAQRTRELALLRAVGASRRQVSASVVGEGLVVGVVASVLGLGLGVLLAIGLRNLIASFGVELPAGDIVFEPRTAAFGLAVGIGVTLVSVLGPARRSTKVPPVAAIAAVDATPTRRTLGRPVLGSILLVAGLLVGGRALADSSLAVEHRVRTVALGALLVFLGVAAVARFLAGPIIAVIGAPFRRAGGVATRVAARNAVRNPRRTASTASALMIGLALVATTLVVGESVRTAIRGGLTRSISSDVVVDSGSVAPFDATTVDRIAGAQGVADAQALSTARSDTARGGRLAISTGDLPALTRLVDPEIVSGRLPTGDAEIAVASRWADNGGVRLGDRLTLRGGDVTREVRVVGVYQRRELYDDSIAPPAVLRGLLGVEPVTRLVFVDTDPGTSPTAVADRLARLVADTPNSSAQTTSGFVEARTGSVDIILGIVNVLLLFAVLVAGLGIANTLALSVVERTRELGLLRAVGMSRRRMRRMVRVEGLLIALFGGVLGLLVGVGFGAALVAALPVETVEFTLPWQRLVVLLAVAAVLGIVAAALPARRAGRLDVLTAIAED